MSDEPIETRQERVADQAAALAALPEGMAVMQMENDTLRALALAHPRRHAEIRDEIMEQLEAYPEFAEVAVYAKPVGVDRRTGKMKYAEGLSVRAAEAVRVAYKHNRVSTSSDPHPHDPALRVIRARFMDYQTGTIWEDSRTLTPFYTKRGGGVGRTPEGRFDEVTVPAAKSRLLREVILRSVPPGLKAALLRAANEVELTDDQEERALDHWERKGVSVENLEALIGERPWNMKSRRRLLQLWTAVEDGEVSLDTIKEAVRPEPEEEAPSGDEAPTDAAGSIKSKLAAQGADDVPPGAEAESATIPDDENPFMGAGE